MPNNFGLFFSDSKKIIRLPVNPEKLPVARDTSNDEYNVLGIGPIMVPRTPNLRTVSISSYFPGRETPEVLTINGFEPPEFYIDFFFGAMRKKQRILYTPVRYYEDGTPFMMQDTGFWGLVTEFNTEERGGETGDFYYDLVLTEYKDYSPKTVQVQQLTATTEPTREIPQGQLYVGCTAIINGPYYATSYGEEPHGNGNGRRCVISRIITTDPTRPYPIHVNSESGGAWGWAKEESLQAVSSK